jgi:hypothetical protein
VGEPILPEWLLVILIPKAAIPNALAAGFTALLIKWFMDWLETTGIVVIRKVRSTEEAAFHRLSDFMHHLPSVRRRKGPGDE